MAIQTYRESTTGKIYTADGKHIASLPEYQQRVASGEISGKPISINSAADISKTPTPSAYRTEDGGIAYTSPSVTPNTSFASSLSSLGGLKNNTAFLEAAKDIIRRKQGIQQPLQDQKNYWRTLQRDTSPFGGTRNPKLQIPGMFTDDRMRELSPSEQASVRASRDAASSAHLQGIGEEERYNETRLEDIVGAISDMMAEQDKIAEDDLLNQSKALNNLKDIIGLGITPTDQDYKNAGLDVTNGRSGGTISWRYNNPGNIKFGEFAKKYGAVQGNNATDGGSFAVFPTLEAGQQAMKDLLKAPSYANLTLDQAMKRWSGNGYGADVLGYRMPSNLLMKDIINDPNILNDLVTAMTNREGWKEGTIIGAVNDDKVNYVSQLTGFSIEDLKALSVEELELLESTYNEITKAGIKEEFNTVEDKKKYDEVKKFVLDEKAKGIDPNLVYSMVIRNYSNQLNSTQINTIMNEVASNSNLFTMEGKWMWIK